MTMLDREVKQNKNAALLALLNQGEEKAGQTEKPQEDAVSTGTDGGKKEKKQPRKDPRKLNPQGYQRNRGRGGTIPMSYYLPKEIITLLNVKAAKEGKTKSELVLEGLQYVLREEIREEKRRQAEEGRD